MRVLICHKRGKIKSTKLNPDSNKPDVVGGRPAEEEEAPAGEEAGEEGAASAVAAVVAAVVVRIVELNERNMSMHDPNATDKIISFTYVLVAGRRHPPDRAVDHKNRIDKLNILLPVPP